MVEKQHSSTARLLRSVAPTQPAEPEPIAPPEPEKLDERGMRRQTLYLPPQVYDQIREKCFFDRIAQQEFFRRVFDFYFQHHGMKRWAELDTKAKKEPKA